MKVLIVTMYHPELVRGGSQQVAYELFQGLKQAPGVEPVLLCSTDLNSPAMFKSGARITGFDQRENEFLFLSHDYDHVWQRLPWPRQAEAFAGFLRRIRPDVVHFNHFMTIGIDYLTLTRRVLPDARIVFTAHEFLTICAAEGHMLRRTDNSLCEKASQVRCHQCLPQRPPEEMFLREQWMRTHLAVVDYFTVPSRFMIDVFARWGLDTARFRHVPNGQDMLPRVPEAVPARRNRFGFFGQLVDVKGVSVLLEAVQILRAAESPPFVVEINGENIHFASPEKRKEIESFLEEEARRPVLEQRVRFNGGYHHDQLATRMARVDWVVVPSIWWEIYGLVMSEAWHFGRPVIASNKGGMAERVRDGVDGLLFEIGDAHALAATMHRAMTEEKLWETLEAGITPPPSRADMVQGYLAAYDAALMVQA
ncbi:glycosyltransferase family 4 protein [Acidocella aminolytica]|jgi:glycosyltransferase involved in cell wall biosynthesis|uniref:Glycosyl transferase n=1 Tax=Acidocella aminolytica 101 = DSM 11237 TaxID=1120923 RepID=A0A0D6PK01_9PROT|nr:glycosyltransferase family 4 protein [Acidocella aminolytica]GAN81731.1 glycosyl transferase [Acidocella aminolytica 101 = DSM 11237]GBQ36116.1 glycosyltransferase [Acidocella aminolytica 101 = DSM 11237]SHF43889.1 Glycosyltransferase involved in cell wall bisynthesis [Acidocella aminolytica 101 = DSM 11237]